MTEIQYIKLGWVKPIIIEKLKGIKTDALRKKKEQHLFIEEKHWRKAKDNVIYYNYEELDSLLGGKYD
ncbi:hypothetical protein [Thalassotalea fusca]